MYFSIGWIEELANSFYMGIYKFDIIMIISCIAWFFLVAEGLDRSINWFALGRVDFSCISFYRAMNQYRFDYKNT